MQCSLCGFVFDETQMNCHSSCTFNQSCGIICCPNCGFQVADERKSRLASALRDAIARRKQTVITGKCRLTSLQPGQSGTVLEIQTENHARAERLQVLGIMPGAHIRLEQKQPVFVLEVGFTEISVERTIANNIIVHAEALPQ